MNNHLLEQIHDYIARDDNAGLEALLMSDEAARRVYLQYTIESVSLRRWATGVQGSGVNSKFKTRNSNQKTTPQPQFAAGESSSFEFRISRFVLAAAAAVALAATAWFFTPEPRPLNPEPSAATRSVAMLSDLHNAMFAEGQRPMNLGGELAADSIRLVSGKAQIMFDSTAVVDLVGPCEFRMIDANRGQLTSGRLEAFVPEAARGFAIDLPDGWRVVDLGTRFFVDARPAARSVVGVIEGRVRIETAHQRHELAAGRAVTLADGRVQSAPSMAAFASVMDVYSYFPMDGGIETRLGPGGKVVGTLTPTEDRFGRAGGAVMFDGESYVPLDVAWPADAYTMAAWVRPNRITGQQQYLVGVQNSGNNPGRFLRLSEQGTVQVTHVAGPQAIFKIEGPIAATGQWTHLAATFEPTGEQRGLLTLYINGQPIAATPVEGDSTQTASLKNLTIGARPDHPGEFPFDGALDDVVIFDRVLPAQQVLDLYTISETQTQSFQEN